MSPCHSTSPRASERLVEHRRGASRGATPTFTHPCLSQQTYTLWGGIPAAVDFASQLTPATSPPNFQLPGPTGQTSRSPLADFLHHPHRLPLSFEARRPHPLTSSSPSASHRGSHVAASWHPAPPGQIEQLSHCPSNGGSPGASALRPEGRPIDRGATCSSPTIVTRPCDTVGDGQVGQPGAPGLLEPQAQAGGPGRGEGTSGVQAEEGRRRP